MTKDLQLLIHKYQRLLKHGEEIIIKTDKNNPFSSPKCQPVINNVWKIIIKDLIELADKQVDDKFKNK